jgi:hypothetical protein
MRHILHKESHNEKEQCRRNIIHIAVRGNKRRGRGAGRGGRQHLGCTEHRGKEQYGGGGDGLTI